MSNQTVVEPPSESAVKTERRARPDFTGGRLRLSSTPIQGYHLCWVNEDRLAEFEEMGYQFVTQGEQSGQTGSSSKRSGAVELRGKDLGENVRRLVGKNEAGAPLYAYLMKIDDLLFKEGMATIEERNKLVIDNVNRLIKTGSVPGETNFYAQQGNKMTNSRTPRG